MSVSISQRSFTGGEWAPSLYARVDLEKYSTAVRTMKNAFPHPHGGASNRGGTEFVAVTKDSSKVSRLVPFQFSTEQSYILEFGDQYIRVCKDGGRVVEANVTITGATQADPVVITATAHGYSNGDWVVISSVVGMTELNGKTYIVVNKATNTFELTDIDGNNVDGTGYTAYSSGGVCNKVYEVSTSYVEADLSLLKFTQSADVLYITHPSYAPAKLSRTGHASWTLSTITFAAGISAPTGFSRSVGTGTTNTYAVTAITIDGEESIPSATAVGDPGDTFSWNSVTNADYYNIYQVKNSVYGYLGTSKVLTFLTEANVDPDMSDTTPTARNPFSGADKYPGCSVFFEQRWVPARTNDNPQTIWGSVTGAFENMNTSVPLKDDDAYNFTIDSQQVNEIRWMISMESLIIGTSGAEFRMKSGANSDSVTPTSVDMKQQSKWGVSHIKPIVIGNSVIFVEASGSVVRDLVYSLEIDGYKGNDLSILSNHLFRGLTIDEWAYQQHPDSIIWCIRSDGTLVGLTYHREHQVWGWHRHDTEGYFKSVASIVTGVGEDEVYVIVERIINGITRKFIEILKDRLPADEYGNYDVQDSFFVDCGLSLNNPIDISGATQADPVVVTATAHGFSNDDLVDIVRVQGMTELNNIRYKVVNVAANTFELQDEDGNDIDGTGYTSYILGGEVRKTVTTISGLGHLEGKDVSVLANGNVIPGITVSSGAITLPSSASRVHIGLGYITDIETLDFEHLTDSGTLQDKLRDIDSVVLELENTRALWVGPNEDRLNEIPFRENEAYGQPTGLYNDDKEINIESGEERKGRVFFRNTDPVPFTILSATVRMTYGER